MNKQPTPNTRPFGYGPMTATFGRFVSAENFSAFGPALPVPTAEDKAQAAEIVAAWYDRPRYCPIWVARHRASLIESTARQVMRDRLRAEWRASREAVPMLEAAE